MPNRWSTPAVRNKPKKGKASKSVNRGCANGNALFSGGHSIFAQVSTPVLSTRLFLVVQAFYQGVKARIHLLASAFFIDFDTCEYMSRFPE
jgi:hypothetical protein